MAQKLELEDFSGGITDYYLSAPPNKLKECDNLLINQYQNQGKVFTRFGSEVYDLTAPLPEPNAIRTCFNYKNNLYVQVGPRLYYYKSTTVAVADLVSNEVYQITNLGNTNFVDLGAASNTLGIYFKYNGATASGTGSVRKGSWEEISGEGANKAFPGSLYDHVFSYDHWNYQTLMVNSSLPGYPMKIISYEGQSYITQAGLPKFDGSGVTFSFTTGGGKRYLYKLVYKRVYYAGANAATDIQFIDLGSPSAALVVDDATDGTPNVTIENIPVLSNSSETNWELTNIKIDIYRTLADGTVYYYVSTIDNGTTEFIDPQSDTNLEGSEQLYTTGGVVENDQPPKCRSIHIKNDIAYYGNVGDNYFRMLQSIPGDIDSVPETFYVDVDDDIVAISSTKNNVIILCKEKVYRVDGIFDELGRGGMIVERISDTAGCIGVGTVVQALDGVLWLGKTAVYYTDGFQVVKLNQDYDVTYKTFTLDDSKNAKYQGKYDRTTNRVWWTIQDQDAEHINKCYVLDLNWGIRQNSTFTTVSGESFAPFAIEFINGNMIRCDKAGYVLLHADGLFVDPKIDTSKIALEWRDEAIVYSMETSAYNFGTSAVRKYVTQANVTCESNTNLALQIVSNNDDNRIVSNLLPIRYRNNILWGEPDVYWGDLNLEWNRQGLIHEKRLMPARNLRCNYKSLKFTNAHVAILSSDVLKTNVNVNAGLKTATLSNITYDWPTKSIGYFISFEFDNYTKEYEIIGRSDDILTFADPLNTSISGTFKWVIRGKPIGEVLSLLNVSVIYDIAGPSQNAFKVSGSGEVQS